MKLLNKSISHINFSNFNKSGGFREGIIGLFLWNNDTCICEKSLKTQKISSEMKFFNFDFSESAHFGSIPLMKFSESAHFWSIPLMKFSESEHFWSISSMKYSESVHFWSISLMKYSESVHFWSIPKLKWSESVRFDKSSSSKIYTNN